MSRIEDLIGTINDNALQVELLEEIERLKQRKDFGLVFERHHPESLLLGSAVGVRIGDQVRVRTEPSNRTTYRVLEVDGGQATIEAVRTNKPSESRPAPGTNGTPPEQRAVALGDLMVVQPFGQPIYPGLTSVDRVQRSDERPYHTVINAENYHALELLVHVCAGQVDCIYIDPPYNTGARDWKYDNDYVDSADRYQHSKWLSFMEKRLALAKQLLKPDGVLICTIDENEVNHLGLLLEQELPQARTQMVTITINPSGAMGATGMSRVEEYAFFCFLGDAQPSRHGRRLPDRHRHRQVGDRAARRSLGATDARRHVLVSRQASEPLLPGATHRRPDADDPRWRSARRRRRDSAARGD
jgi:adenine-specific DNA-methyltransferase